MDSRIRRAVESISGDMSLTEDMNDPEAMQLIDWGTTAARYLAMDTVEMDDYQADEYLNEQIPNLRRVMRRVNSLIGELPWSSAEENAATLARIGEAAAESQVVQNTLPEDVSLLAQQITNMEQMMALETVLGHLAIGYVEGDINSDE